MKWYEIGFRDGTIFHYLHDDDDTNLASWVRLVDRPDNQLLLETQKVTKLLDAHTYAFYRLNPDLCYTMEILL